MANHYLALLVLASMPLTAFAEPEWVLAGGKNDGTYRIYVRNDAKRLPHGLVEAWEVWDYKEPQTDNALKITYRSRLWKQSFNCTDRSAAVMSLTFYSDSMGKGTALHSMSRPADKIKYVRAAPDSPGEFMMTKVCSWVR